VYACTFNSAGTVLASGGHDRSILLWDVFEKGQNNSGLLKGHVAPVLDLSFSLSSDRLFSASADKTLGVWDPEAGVLVRRIKNVHKSYVNAVSACALNNDLFASGSDEGLVCVWDARTCRKPKARMQASTAAVCAVAMAIDGTRVFTGGLDNSIKCYDLRNTEEPVFELQAHRDTVTGLAVSPDGLCLLSNSMDQTLCSWNIRPFVGDAKEGGQPPSRLLRTFTGHTHDFQKLLLRCSWSPDGTRVSGGSADQVRVQVCVCVFFDVSVFCSLFLVI
jgi:Prp8 binding protein